MRKLIYSFGVWALAEVAVAERVPAGDELWGGRVAHPALVNEVMAIPGDPYRMRLRGEWDFMATPSDNQRNHPWASCFLGEGEYWERPEYPIRKIQVPGCWEAQLADDQVSTGRAWFCGWDSSPQPIRGYHSGDGWYRREVVIPQAWRQRRVWLKTGWVNSMGWFWLNGKQVAMDRNYCATYKYDVTDLVKFGEKNMLVVQVNNAAPSHRGCLNSQNHWGGILRDLELSATPAEVWIDDAWVKGDFDTMSAEVKVTLGGDPSKGRVVTEVPRALKPWSPEAPNLYTAKVELVSLDGKVLETRYERFGIRKLETRGRQVYLNGRPLALRGAGWHAIDPINGYAKPDRARWLELARKIRAAGFNFVRNHSECKMPEFFEACDEAGLMVEAELPYYGDVASDGQRFDPLADAAMLYAHFRRHPSWIIYSFGNEGGFGPYLSKRLYAEVKARDPDRLVNGQDGGWNSNSRNPTNYRGTSDFSGAPITVIRRGALRPELPYFYHEFINSSVKFDYRSADGFTGVRVSPISADSRLRFLQRFGLDHEWGDRLQDAQNHLQKIYLKYGLESARLDPFACGYCYWSLQDACSPQGDTYIGQALWDPFWRDKRCGSTAAEVAVFNSDVCLLMTDRNDPEVYPVGKNGGTEMFLDSMMTNRVREAGDTIRARFHLANFAERTIAADKLEWRLLADGRELGAGSVPVGAAALASGLRPLAEVDLPVPSVERAVKATLRVQLGEFHNAWHYWLFPKRTPIAANGIVCERKYLSALAPRYPGLGAAEAAKLAADQVVIAEYGGELERTALAAGCKVISLANQHTASNVQLGWWYMTEQMGAALKRCDLLAGLPHEGKFDELCFRIGKVGLPLPVAGFAAKDFVMVGEGGKGCYLYLAATSRRILIAGLDVLTPTCEGNAILDAAMALLTANGFTTSTQN